MQCRQCQAVVTQGARFCAMCGAAVEGHVPACPRCGGPVRVPADGPFPRRRPGLISETPWNEDWDGACPHCGLRFEVEHVLNTRLPPLGWGIIRRAVFRHGHTTNWQGLDLQICLAGVTITIETVPWQGERHSEQFFLTIAEAQALCRALAGPLRILTEQHDWTWDTT